MTESEDEQALRVLDEDACGRIVNMHNCWEIAREALREKVARAKKEAEEKKPTLERQQSAVSLACREGPWPSNGTFAISLDAAFKTLLLLREDGGRLLANWPAEFTALDRFHSLLVRLGVKPLP